MARKLPWATAAAPPVKRSRVDQSTNEPWTEQALPDAISRDDDDLPPPFRGRVLKSNTSKGSRPRTPSTSPPRAPPPIELMRNGYDDDDIYIMVEDEFQTVAQSYTAHLHHAEYKRLVKAARDAPTKELPEPTSPMSKEAKARMKSAALQKRQSDTLRNLTGQPSIEQDEEDKIGDLWSGTSLAPFMSQGSQQKTSLVGLERISSSTRAGSGYSRPKSRSNQLEDEDEDVGSTGQQVSAGGLSSAWAGPPATSSRTSRDRVEETVPRERAGIVGWSKPSSRHQINQRHGRVDRERASSSTDGHSTESIAEGSNSSFSKRKQDKEREKRSRLDEVPMFII